MTAPESARIRPRGDRGAASGVVVPLLPPAELVPVCVCPSPILEPLPGFGGVQCTICYRAPLDSLLLGGVRTG